MVLAHENMDGGHARSIGRRVSSPIAIQPGKLAHLQRLAERSRENQSSPASSPGDYSTSPDQINSLPLPVRYMHLSQISRDGNLVEGIFEDSDHLPECSPAFNTVFSELVNLEESRHENGSDRSGSSPLPDTDSMQSTPNLPRKELRFALDEEFEKMRVKSSSSYTYGRKPKRKNAPSSTHSTPSLSRRSKKGISVTRPANVVPKYKFLTETVTVSHEDIVREQENQEKHENVFGSPKSIFSIVGN